MLKFFVGILAIAAIIFCVVCAVAFVYAITKWNDAVKRVCDESECDSCPFPCEKHDNTIKFD